MTDTSIRDNLERVVKVAEEKLAEAEAVAKLIPNLRKQVRELRRTLAGFDALDETTPAVPGKTIKERIIDSLEAAGGSIKFDPGTMAPTVHDLVKGNRNSIQVEIHRLEELGRLVIERDESGRPMGLALVKTAPAAKLMSVTEDGRPHLDDVELREG